MDEFDKNIIIERYNSRLEKYGYDIRTLASGTENRRNLRFQILTEIGVETGDSVLDIGCGFGDYYNYLRQKEIKPHYTGYDINSKIVEIAKVKYPEALFEVKDIQKDQFPRFDYIVSTSSFNLKLKKNSNYEFVKELLNICYLHADKGVAIDFMSSYVDYRVPNVFYYEPEIIFELSKKISKRVCLRHDYPLFEFCVYIYPDFVSWNKNKPIK